jgi:GH25 family lysozyme M1 (1,4-beta-N-acetylmuramidase)
MTRRRIRRTLLRWLTAALSTVAVLAVTGPPAQAATVPGIDVSHHQGAINWTSVRGAGMQFAYLKATEGVSFTDPRFDRNYVAAYRAGVIRGGYHFALPNRSGGAAQADFFFRNGGAWSADNRTLPGALDLEYNPYGATCYGLSRSAMVAWVRAFLDRYHARTGRWAVIYTTTNWWATCTGNYAGFAARHPLWLARYASSPGALPRGWPVYTFWQYTSTGRVPGVAGNVDRNVFNGSRARLLALANNTR